MAPDSTHPPLKLMCSTVTCTRMHSSRIRPLQWPSRGEGGCLPRGASAHGGVSAQVGVSAQGVSARGCLPGGMFTQEGMSAQGGGLLRGCLPGESTSPPPVNRITDRCKNITFTQLRFADGNKSVKI